MTSGPDENWRWSAVNCTSCLNGNSITIMSSFSNRSNLDPWDQYSDSQIWESLEKTHIKEMVSHKSHKHCQIRSNDALLNRIKLSYVSSHLCMTSCRSASCLIRSTRRWRRTERTSQWENDSCSAWPGPCCATARCCLYNTAPSHLHEKHCVAWWW